MASRMAARVMKVFRVLARFSIAAARNLFTTDVPVNIAVCNDGTRWVVTRVIVEDTDVDLDMKHVRAYDPVNDAKLTRTTATPDLSGLALAAAFQRAERGGLAGVRVRIMTLCHVAWAIDVEADSPTALSADSSNQRILAQLNIFGSKGHATC